MPKKVHDCAKKVMAKGMPESNAWAICNAQVGKHSSKKKKKKAR